MKVVSNASPLVNLARIGQRETAAHFGLRCVGLVGILSEAKQRGLVQELRPLLDQLHNMAGFWLSSALYQQVLRDARELP